MVNKIRVEGHRKAATVDDISQIFTVATRTFDYDHAVNHETNKKVTRIEVAKLFVNLIESLGEDINHYSDAFPAEWDIRFE